MPTVSTIPGVKTELLRLLQAEPALANVGITYSPPRELKRASIYFTGTTFTHALATIRSGRKNRDELYTLRLEIAACGPGQASPSAEARAFELLETIENVLADNPNLGGELIEWAELSECTAGLDENLEGWSGLIRIGIECHARLT